MKTNTVLAVSAGAALLWAGMVAAGDEGPYFQCVEEWTICEGDFAQCEDDLAQCESEPCTGLPATGQATPYGEGSDGDVQAGAALSYTDNADGTITDNTTGLRWEKKDSLDDVRDPDNVHDADNLYLWCADVDEDNVCDNKDLYMDGTMVTEFLAGLNTEPCFAGYCDWRIPNIKELHSIVNYENLDPTVSPEFDSDCVSGCTVDGAGETTMCSCTQSNVYCSSTTNLDRPTSAWGVRFSEGYVGASGKSGNYCYVRAVRGGS